MPVRKNDPSSLRPAVVRHIALRVGMYIGLALSIALTAWVIVANRVPFLQPFDRERNLAATTVIGLFVLIPIMRYMSAPRALLASGLMAWAILSATYSLLCMYFPGLSNIRTPSQVLAFGFLFYLISATVAWMIGVVWRVRQNDSSHSHQHR
jgi:hypothetical protein